MAKETVDKIILAENAAEKAEADARQQAFEMIEKAKSDAAVLVDRKIREAEEAANLLIGKAGADAEKIMNEACCDASVQISEQKKEEAIKACLSMLVKTGGR